jgi:hypothetical protein
MLVSGFAEFPDPKTFFPKKINDLSFFLFRLGHYRDLSDYKTWVGSSFRGIFSFPFSALLPFSRRVGKKQNSQK